MDIYIGILIERIFESRRVELPRPITRIITIVSQTAPGRLFPLTTLLTFPTGNLGDAVPWGSFAAVNRFSANSTATSYKLVGFP